MVGDLPTLDGNPKIGQGEEVAALMRVRQLKLSGFRNYRELDLAPGEGINILYGENAQGKSNVLEALSLLATTRSLRANRESELIQQSSEMAHITAEVTREREGDVELQVSIYQTDKKAVRVNGIKRPRVVDALGQFNAVFFGSIDLAIVSGEPSTRRHYLNVEISQISPRYVYDLARYKRVLEQRNRLLRDLRDRPRRFEESGLEAWNEQLVLHGAPLFEKRAFYLERLAPLAARAHRLLTDDREELELRYLPSIVLPENTEWSGGSGSPSSSVESGEDAGPARSPESAPTATERVANAFRAYLSALAPDEARRGTTLAGPQRDDLCFIVNGMDARIYCSQGQQRTVALALKLAEHQLIEDYVGEMPVLLLDDVMSDLDDARRSHLMEWVSKRGQTFITCTNLRAFPKEILDRAKTLRVVGGTVTPDA